MSPTSYQTAPPRDNPGIIGSRLSRVKQILNKINNLREALILLGLSRLSHITQRFPPQKSMWDKGTLLNRQRRLLVVIQRI